MAHPTTRPADIAISFAAPDKAVADEVSRRLKRRGLAVYHWEESPEITLGQALAPTLDVVYRNAAAVIVLFSVHYLQSPHTGRELTAALAGSAAQEGVFLVRLDQTAVPDALSKRAWWDLGRGTTPLVDAVARRFGRRPLTRHAMFAGAALVTAAFLVWVLVALGFRVPTRWPDSGFLLAAFLPLAWFVGVHVAPVALSQAVGRRRPGRLVLQSVVERRVEFVGPYLAWLVVLALVIVAALGVQVRRQVLATSERAAALQADLEIAHRTYYQAMSDVTRLASTAPASVPALDARRLEAIRSSYRTTVADALSQGAHIRRTLVDRAEFGASVEAEDYRTCLVSLETNANRNLGHQVDRLAEAAPPGISHSELLQRKHRLAGLLTMWNTRFAQQLIECDGRFTTLRRSLSSRRGSYASHWRGVLGT